MDLKVGSSEFSLVIKQGKLAFTHKESKTMTKYCKFSITFVKASLYVPDHFTEKQLWNCQLCGALYSC
jgi:hypothetical protein